MNHSSFRKTTSLGLSKSAFKMVLLPLLTILICLILIGILLFNQNLNNPPIFDKWLNISIILLSLFLFLPGIFLFILIITLFFMVSKFQIILLPVLEKMQSFTFNTSKFILNSSKVILFPISFFESVKKIGRNK
jgi:hypothetical protein